MAIPVIADSEMGVPKTLSGAKTKNLLIIEEGSAFAGMGAELIAQIIEQTSIKIKVKRIAAYPVPIPSVKTLEHIVLPEKDRIIKEIKAHF